MLLKKKITTLTGCINLFLYVYDIIFGNVYKFIIEDFV